MSAGFRLDLLRGPAARLLLRQPWFPVAFQALGLLGLGFLAFNGWGVGEAETPARLLVLRKTNLTTLVVWGLWWPAMIGLALALGRAWCTVCPMELASRLGHGLGRRLGTARLRLPRWMRAGWSVLAAYLLLQLLVAGVSLHRVPHLTSLMLVGLLALAGLAGALFAEERAFCKGLCPSAALLSVYGRHTPLQLDVRSPESCAACVGKDCVRADRRERFDARSCPSLLRPFARAPSDGCVLCLQCAKTCPHDNVGLGLAARTAKSRRPALLAPAEAAFVALAAGFVAHEVIGEVKWLDGLFHAAPAALARAAPAVGFGGFEALWFLVLFPAMLWSLVAALAWALGHRGRLGELLLAAATGAAPIVAIAHLAKAGAKLTSWAGFLPLALRDPAGERTLEHLASEPTALPAALLQLPLVGWLATGLLLLVGLRAWRAAREAAPRHRSAAAAGFGVATALFGGVLTVWIGG